MQNELWQTIMVIVSMANNYFLNYLVQISVSVEDFMQFLINKQI